MVWFNIEGRKDIADKAVAGREQLSPAVLNSVMTNDYSRLADYCLWTLFPFCKMARDNKGIIENPFYTIEKMTGIPYIKLLREIKKDVQKTPDDTE